MGDDPFQEQPDKEFENKKKNGRSKKKPNLLLKTNLDESRNLESKDSEVDVGPMKTSLEDEALSTKQRLASNGFQQIGETNWMRSTTSVAKQEGVETFNEKALSKFAVTYELEKYKKHALIIFNQQDFFDGSRHGTISDVEALTDTFEKFGFEVKENVHHDLTKKEIFQELEEFIKRDYTEYGCVGVAILTHGSHYGRLRAKDIYYNEIEIVNYLKSRNKPTLVSKPKFLIIQACRGQHIKPPVPVFPSPNSYRYGIGTATDLEPYHLPEEADILVLHSCYMGNPSFRDVINGSWFIQTLCKKIKQFAAAYDLESIITEMKREVAIDRVLAIDTFKENEIRVQICQMPVLTSTLIRKLYLKKFGEAPPLYTGMVLPISELDVTPSTSKDGQTLDPSTPLSYFRFDDHFNYMRTCLKYFVEDNPDDKTGRLHLELANEFDDKAEHNNAKQMVLRLIHDHLKKNFEYYKYLHLCDN